ncbi:MAG TPA: methyltransferase domain-containing protein [Coriobacteriia bacterium]|nr:methyltransferase domain-containing protein [Coriobacteriia bacterium]
MKAEAVAVLACPVCGTSLAHAENVLRCEQGHAFDIARQGYANLLTAGAPSAGDTAQMVEARADFLARGHFAPIAEAVAAEVAFCSTSGCVMAEVGAGTAYYLAAALDAAPGSTGVALDLSKYAARRAAKAHPAIASVVANAWDALPLRDASVAVLLDIFAPRNAAEFARVLTPAGLLVVVTPGPEHLTELVSALGLLAVDRDKDARVFDQLGVLFERSADRHVGSKLELTHDEIMTVVGMGPSAYHVESAELSARIAKLPEPMEVTLDVTLTLWEPRPDAA